MSGIWVNSYPLHEDPYLQFENLIQIIQGSPHFCLSRCIVGGRWLYIYAMPLLRPIPTNPQANCVSFLLDSTSTSFSPIILLIPVIMGKKRVLVGYGVDIDAVAGWLGSYGGEDSVSDISRGKPKCLRDDRCHTDKIDVNQVSGPDTSGHLAC